MVFIRQIHSYRDTLYSAENKKGLLEIMQWFPILPKVPPIISIHKYIWTLLVSQGET